MSISDSSNLGQDFVRQQAPHYEGTSDAKKLTDEASDQKVSTQAAGAQVVINNRDFQSTAEGGIASTQKGLDAKVAYDVTNSPADPQLVAPDTSSTTTPGTSSSVNVDTLANGSSSYVAGSDDDNFSFFDSSNPTPSRSGSVATATTPHQTEACSYVAPRVSSGTENPDGSTTITHPDGTTTTSGGTTTTGSTTTTTTTATTTPPIVVLSNDQLAEIHGLSSKNSSTVLAQLQQLLTIDGGPITLDQLTVLKELAAQISEGNRGLGIDGLDSDDQTIVQAGLLTLYSDSDPKIIAMIGSLSTSIAKVNTQLAKDLASTDSATVQKALTAMVDMSSLTPKQAVAANSYLRLLADALSFMSEIRATMTTEEADFTNKTAQAKTDITQGMQALALQQYQVTTSDILTNLTTNIQTIADNAAAAANQQLMSILGPIITVLTTLVAIAITAFTLGLASPLAAFMITASVVMCGVTLSNQCITTTNDQGQQIGWIDNGINHLPGGDSSGIHELWKLLFTAGPALLCGAGAAGAALQAGATAAVEVGATAAASAAADAGTSAAVELTDVGASGAAEAGTVAAEGGSSGASTATTAASRWGVMLGTSAGRNIVGTIFLESVFSSGLVTTGMYELSLKCIHAHKPPTADEQSQAAIGAMIGTAIVMLGAVAAPGAMSALGSAASSAGSKISSFVSSFRNAGSAAAEEGIELAEIGANAASSAGKGDITLSEAAGEAGAAGKGAGRAASAAGEAAAGASRSAADVESMINSASATEKAFIAFLKKLRNLALDPNTYVNIAQIVEGAVQARADFAEANAQEELAGLTTKRSEMTLQIGQLQATIDFLQSCLPGYDQTMKNVETDMKQDNKNVSALCDMMNQFVSDASEILNKATG